MSQKMQQGALSRRTRARVFRIYLMQLGVTVLVGALCWLIAGQSAGVSAWFGGVIYLVPNVYFGHRVLQQRQSETVRHVLAQMYISEIWKMVLTALLFALAFALVHPLSPFSLFATYILLHLIGWVAQIRLNKRFQKL